MRYCLRDSAPLYGPLAISGMVSCACERRGKRRAGAAAASPNTERLVIDMATSVTVYFSAENWQAEAPAPPSRGSEDFFRPVFQCLLDLGHELVGQGAVDQAMVEAQREMADAADGDGVVDHYRSLIDGADAHDGDLGLINDRRAHQAAEAAEVGDGECAARHLVWFELPRAGARRQIHNGALQAEHVLLVRAANDGDDQAVVESDRDADVNFIVVDDVVAIQRGVEQGILAQDGHRGTGDERQVGAVVTVGGLELRLVLVAHARHFGHVDAMDGRSEEHTSELQSRQY